LKARFMSDPGTVLAEHGMSIPDNVDIKVLENTDNRVYITLPMAPQGHDGLSDAELSQAAR
jgi:hypothetical protein